MRISDWSSTCALPISATASACACSAAHCGRRVSAAPPSFSDLSMAAGSARAGQRLRLVGDALHQLVPGLDEGLRALALQLRGQCVDRSEKHTSELQSLMRISYAVFCLKNKHHTTENRTKHLLPTDTN